MMSPFLLETRIWAYQVFQCDAFICSIPSLLSRVTRRQISFLYMIPIIVQCCICSKTRFKTFANALPRILLAQQCQQLGLALIPETDFFFV